MLPHPNATDAPPTGNPSPALDALALARLQQRVVSHVSSSPWVHQGNVRELSRLITEQAGRLLGIERVGVWLFDASLDALVCEDLYLLSADRHEQGGVLRRAEFAEEFTYLADSKVVDAHDPYTDPRTRGYVDSYLRPNRISAMLDAVVRTGEELIGLVCFEHVDRPHIWDDSEIVLASQLGDQVALTVAMGRSQTMAQVLRERDLELRQANEALERRVDEGARTLAATREALLASERLASLGQIVAGVAHDLSTPIGSALLTASALHDRIEEFLPQLATGTVRRSVLDTLLRDVAQSAALVHRGLQRSAQLVTSFKHVTADQASDARRRFSLDELVHDIVTMLRPGLQRLPCEVHVEVQVNPHLLLDSYPGALDQVLVNLIMNAAVHGLAEQASGCIQLEAAALNERELLLTVSDNGRGISEALQEHVFERFFTTTRESGGTGLGLHIVRTLVETRLGGTVQLESSAQGGCRVCLRLPFKP